MVNKVYLKNEAERNKAKGELIKLLTTANGYKKIYTVLTHVSSSGMYRHIKLLIAGDDQVLDISWNVARILSNVDYKKNINGVGISGCGMDMGFSIVYELGSALFPNGDGKTITNRNGDTKPETDGGYILKHGWL
jgi:hypothetical protein